MFNSRVATMKGSKVAHDMMWVRAWLGTRKLPGDFRHDAKGTRSDPMDINLKDKHRKSD